MAYITQSLGIILALCLGITLLVPGGSHMVLGIDLGLALCKQGKWLTHSIIFLASNLHVWVSVTPKECPGGLGITPGDTWLRRFKGPDLSMFWSSDMVLLRLSTLGIIKDTPVVLGGLQYSTVLAEGMSYAQMKPKVLCMSSMCYNPLELSSWTHFEHSWYHVFLQQIILSCFRHLFIILKTLMSVFKV